MPEPDFVGLFTGPLEALRLTYMITGATGAILYGQPRLTNDLDLVLELPGADPLHRWALPLRRRMPHGAGEISVAPPEYVILRKLEYFREGGSPKHPSDIKAILKAGGDSLDRAALDSWAKRLGLQDAWEQAQERA